MNSVHDAAYLTAHNQPGGIPALAARLNVNATVLSHKLNPNNNTHHLSVADLMNIMTLTNDHSAMHAMCLELGYLAIPMQSCSIETTTQAVTGTVKEFAQFLQTVTKALADNKVTKNELRRVRKDLLDLIIEAGRIEANLAAMERTGSRK